MADIQRRKKADGEVRWDVRYRDEARKQRKRSFARKVDAQQFANSVETDLNRGEWIDPKRGQELFETWAEKWLATTADRKPKTRESYESILSKHLLPRFGDVPIASIDYPLVLSFIAELQQAGAASKTVRNIRDVLRMVMRLAVRSGAIKVNPVSEVTVRRGGKKEMVFLDPEQIMSLAAEVSAPPARYRRDERRVSGYPEYGLFVRFAAYTGLRAGEMVGLRVKDLELLHRRVQVFQSASEAYGQLQIVPTKTYERRSVPIPRSFIDELAALIAGKSPDDFVWVSPQGGPFRYSNWFKRHYRPAVTRADVPEETRFHDLRHSYAALLIAQGAHPRAIMERMGHSTITVTLDSYGHLFPKLDAALDDLLDGVYRSAGTVASSSAGEERTRSIAE
jgi:integrase